MKKMILFSVIVFGSVTASAAQTSLFIQPNMFLASGPTTSQYFINLNQLKSAVAKVSTATLGAYTFNGASASLVDGSITYDFHRLESSTEELTCWSQVRFKASASVHGPVLSEITADLNCSRHQD